MENLPEIENSRIRPTIPPIPEDFPLAQIITNRSLRLGTLAEAIGYEAAEKFFTENSPFEADWVSTPPQINRSLI